MSVQFHCECSVNQNRVTAPPSYEQPPSERDLQRGVTSGYPVGAVAPVVFKTNSIILGMLKIQFRFSEYSLIHETCDSL